MPTASTPADRALPPAQETPLGLLSSESVPGCKPCVILALRDWAHAVDVCHRLGLLGWDAYPAHCGQEASWFARLVDADWVVVGTGLPDASGLLTSGKLKRECPRLRGILVWEEHRPGGT